MKKIKPTYLTVILVVSFLLALLNPLKMKLNQRIIMSGLIFVVFVWATEAMHKSIACVILLLIFCIFGKTKVYELISFAWSDTILLIITTTLLSVGIMKTGVVHKYVEKLFKKNSSNIFKLMLLSYVFGVILVFLIPQAFARVIIIGSILNSLLLANNEKEIKAKQALIFNGFMAVTMTYMFFNNGDIVLNQAALKFAGEEVQQALNFQEWIKLMAVPSFAASMIVLGLTYLVFKKDLSGFNSDMISQGSYNNNELDRSKQRIAIFSMIVIIALWMTESIHHISPWKVALVGVIIMYAVKVLDKSDFKSVNPHFLLFLMTVFSIGKGLGQAGITETIFKQLSLLIPGANSSTYILVIALIVMILHICIGSSVATMSVVLPILIPLTKGMGYNAEIITLMTYIIVNVHFILPFHHATVMIGTANKYYPENYMLRIGSIMTIVTFILLGCIYIPWWHILKFI